jgi:soluble lytic murein transglycosylase-like protein
MEPRARLLPTVVLWTAACGSARADIYGFSDADGIHYSNVPADSRYTLVLAAPPAPVVGAAMDRTSAAERAEWRRRATMYGKLIDDAARRAGLHPALLRAVIAVESGFDAQAVSQKGAQGLMQLRPSTAQRYGVRRPFDPGDNLRGGAHYLSDLMRRYGDNLELALAAYNAGEESVERYGHAVPPFPETLAYVPAVMNLYRKFLVGPYVPGS